MCNFLQITKLILNYPESRMFHLVFFSRPFATRRNVECSVSTAEIAMTSGGMALNGSYFADEVDIISLDFGFITNTGEV